MDFRTTMNNSLKYSREIKNKTKMLTIVRKRIAIKIKYV